MSFLNFINQFYRRKESVIKTFSSMSDSDIAQKFQNESKNKNSISTFLSGFDLNKNGKLESTEINQLKRISAFIKSDNFDRKKIDTNNDGIFSKEEIALFEQNKKNPSKEINALSKASTDVVHKTFKETKDARLSVFMKAFDRDNNGKLDDDEIKDLQLVSKYLQTDDDFDMETFDTNKDGKLSNEEIAVFKLAKEFDENNDGIIADEEAANLKLAIKFDENKDGVLTDEERANLEVTKVFDANKDGELSQDELSKMQTANTMHNNLSEEVGISPSATGCVDGNYANSGAYTSAMQKLKAEPTIGEKLDSTKVDIKKIENEINTAKEVASREIKEKEQIVKDMESKLLEEQKTDSDKIKEIKGNIDVKSKTIIEKETELRAKENSIMSLKNTISADKIVIAGMKKEYAGLRTDTKNPKVNAKNAARKAQLEQQIRDLEQKIKEDERKLDETTSQRDTLKNTTIPGLKAERTALEDSLKETDSSYNESVDALKEARKTFESEKLRIENARDLEIAKLEQKLKTKQAEALSLSEKAGEIKGKAGQYSAAIDSIMAKNGVLAGKGDLIANIAEEYGIPADVFAAIIAAETGRGTSKAIRYKNNPGGLMDPRTGCQTLQVFDSLETGLRKMASNLKRNYFDKGRTTLATIQPKYCPIGASNDPRGLNKNWLSTTSKFVAQMNNALI